MGELVGELVGEPFVVGGSAPLTDGCDPPQPPATRTSIARKVTKNEAGRRIDAERYWFVTGAKLRPRG